MTESEWLASDDPARMLTYLTEGSRRLLGRTTTHQVSDRKFRLFAVAVARSNGVGSWSNEAAQFLILAEQAADDVRGTVIDLRKIHAESNDALVAEYVVRPDAAEAASEIVAHYLHASGVAAPMAALLREIVGNPFRPLLYSWIGGYLYAHEAVAPTPPRESVSPVSWLTPLVVSLAQAAYDERLTDGTLAPERLLVLSDALEENGREDEMILRHLRGEEPVLREYNPPGGQDMSRPVLFRRVGWRPLTGPHVRGCFVLDLLLGKE